MCSCIDVRLGILDRAPESWFIACVCLVDRDRRPSHIGVDGALKGRRVAAASAVILACVFWRYLDPSRSQGARSARTVWYARLHGPEER